MKNTIAIGLLGPTLDTGKKSSRWERWRPTISLCMHEDLLIKRFELLYQKKYQSLLNTIIKDINKVSPETKVIPHEVNFTDPWDFEEVYGELHDFAKSYTFDPETNDYLVHITTGTHVAQICLYLLTESNYFPSRLIQTGPGKSRNDIKGQYSIIDLDLSKYDRIAMRFQEQQNSDLSFLKSGIDTKNKEFNKIIEEIEKAAINSPEPILITGPTGAGKSRLARKIYELKKSKRQVSKNFVEINCATIRGDMAMSALFGHKKGAFTGALSDRDGLLKSADNGILFLDEIGELGKDEQAMLLRAIEEKNFIPFGSDTETKSDFQLICGTNKNLLEEVEKNNFREDLLARINLWSFKLPGLKQRPEDIEPNINFEIDKFSKKTKKHISFNKEARKKFTDFAKSNKALWKANFRDLNAAVTRMGTLADSGRININTVEDEIKRLENSWYPKKTDEEFCKIKKVLGEDKAKSLDLFDKPQLEYVLGVCMESDNMSQAGRKLFAKSRENKKSPNDADRLKKYLLKFGIGWGDIN